MEFTQPFRQIAAVGVLGNLFLVKSQAGKGRFDRSVLIFLVLLLEPQHLTGLPAQVLVGVCARRVHVVAQSVTSQSLASANDLGVGLGTTRLKFHVGR